MKHRNTLLATIGLTAVTLLAAHPASAAPAAAKPILYVWDVPAPNGYRFVFAEINARVTPLEDIGINAENVLVDQLRVTMTGSNIPQRRWFQPHNAIWEILPARTYLCRSATSTWAPAPFDGKNPVNVGNIAPKGRVIVRFTARVASRFNSQEGDYPLLRVCNITAGESEWHDSTTAQAGDTLAWCAYIHYAMMDGVAHNTCVRVDLPSGDDARIMCWLWSDETTPIDATVVNGITQGIDWPYLLGFIPCRQEYVPRSTRRYTYDTGVELVTQMPDGITTTGINVGDWRGCWRYSGYITFRTIVR